jgi:Ser/Thr protein kinase RdoA (MazF antagonist)
MKQAFHSMSHRGQVRCLAGLARTALGAYPVRGVHLRLLAHFWNTTFRVSVPEGEQYMLRVHHRDQTSVDAVRSELLWLAALHEAGLSVPEPVANDEARLVTVATHPAIPEPRLCVLFRWIEGRFRYRGLTPAHLAQAGDLMARLQRHACRWERPREFTRHRVGNLDPMQRGRDDAFDPAVAQSLIQTVASLCTPETGRVVAAAIARSWATLQALGEEADAFGLIHADLHHRNLLFGKAGIGAIDFDDCGYGHWLYDMAVPLTALERHPDYAALRDAFLTGYRARRSLPAGQEAHLESFIALRRVQNLVGMIEERDHPAFRDRWETHVAYEVDRLRAFIDS